jgi:hypothetical protein
MRTHLSETTEPTRRELSSLRAELVTKSDQVTFLQNALDEEKLKRYEFSSIEFENYLSYLDKDLK